ncbi:MAG TPA: sterol desaturase family protein [Chloroflexia bacterium]|nr:sterol desaturase family protein [Chloroflexia bacterium]
MLHQMVLGFVILAVIFIPLERLRPLYPGQAIFRSGWFTDVIHFFISRVLIQVGTYAGAVLFYILLHRLLHTPFQAAITSQPAWLQFLEAYLVAETSFYSLHRLSHAVPWLWKFHAIHHSSENLDWLASVRLHPVEMIMVNLTIGVPLALLGFSAQTFGVYTIVSTFLAILNHANVRVSYGPLRWLVADPHYHHWHHANQREAINKNFAGLPLLDFLFGTLYIPKNIWPQRYGVDEYIGKDYLSQLSYPFRKSNARKEPEFETYWPG